MNVFTAVNEIRQERWQNPRYSWGLVPTMGFLHEGHLSLVRQARQENDRVGVSIFVNPAQFNDPKDLDTYPRNMERDLALLKSEGVDLVWTPPREVVYPADFQTYVNVEKVSLPLEGAKRPGHFQGVTTVVNKLFNVFQPQRAYFGQKDAQQVVVIKQMVADLNMNVQIVVCPIVREADGLAMSSRNVNLSPEARQQATCLYQALNSAKTALAKGKNQAKTLHSHMLAIIEANHLTQVDYVSIANPITLEELTEITDSALISMAVFVGGIRLIDNLIVEKSV